MTESIQWKVLSFSSDYFRQHTQICAASYSSHGPLSIWTSVVLMLVFLYLRWKRSPYFLCYQTIIGCHGTNSIDCDKFQKQQTALEIFEILKTQRPRTFQPNINFNRLNNLFFSIERSKKVYEKTIHLEKSRSRYQIKKYPVRELRIYKSNLHWLKG